MCSGRDTGSCRSCVAPPCRSIRRMSLGAAMLPPERGLFTGNSSRLLGRLHHVWRHCWFQHAPSAFWLLLLFPATSPSARLVSGSCFFYETFHKHNKLPLPAFLPSCRLGSPARCTRVPLFYRYSSMHRADFLASVSHLMLLYRRRGKAVKPSPNSIPVLGVNANPLRRPQHILSLVSRQ